ncbi:MAG: fatty acid desaturase [Chlamydiales bacterium]|nr:fatty acid desaturase [Chlamydiales bacterium]
MRIRDYNWRPASLFVLIYHVVLLFALPIYFYYNSPSWGMWTATIILYFATGMSITGGYHRFYSHQAYKAHPIAEWFLVFFGSMACQGSILRWSYEHRIHHAYVDTDKDPYSINKGFWFAHVLWLFHHPKPIENKVVSDLLRNPLVAFQHKYYKYLMFGTNIMAFLFVGWLLNDYLGAFVISWWLRLLCLHHSTWFINSLAHTWGARTFSSEQTAVDNFIISLLTFGEGYHNYHHTFANDYRNGIRWYHFDPTKWMIWTFNRLGLASSLKRVNEYHVKERMLDEKKGEVLDALKASLITRKDEISSTISHVSEEITKKLAKAREQIEQYAAEKNSGTACKDQLKKYTREIKTLQKSIRVDWKQFKQLYKYVMSQSAPVKAAHAHHAHHAAE